jgi:AraC-like DNA-binding protein
VTANPFHKRYLPSQKLNCIVRDIQVLHVTWSPGTKLPPPFITCLANTEQNLYFYPHEPVKIVSKDKASIVAPPAVLTGPKTKPVGILYGKDYLMIKIAFHPTALFRLLGTPMRPLVNKGLNAEDFFGREATTVFHALRATSSYDEMVVIVTDFLKRAMAKKLRPEEPLDKTAIAMLDPLRDDSGKQWSAEACLSVRQFERNFAMRTGISPKLFTRIVRFERVMKIKDAHPHKTWSEIAMECGYTDSAHILKEFRSFAEFPPSDFFLRPTSGYSELPTG